MTRKRTKKEFKNYNEYQDRPFGLKWGTAFALAELTKTIDEGKDDALKVVSALPQMDREEIDAVLQFAFLKSKVISVQVNLMDDHQRLRESVTGKFEGMADDSFFYVEDYAISWDIVRNVAVIK
ncbi:hypothetical protein [Erysipelothrix aquatica]|uniref:hypothetical protein n=1 Tax=Erysipelothrix aquatica TaxID=2683714 RepID=UPI0013571D9D|nr:hypothetical protein [Erysipelothrix aquatica]